MECFYCREPIARRAQANRTANSRVTSPKGDVHAKCLAYLVIDLGLEAAFGNLTNRERSILLARLALPTADHDRAEGRMRYRKVHEAAALAGSYAPEVTDKTAELLNRMRRRAQEGSRATEITAEARRHIEQAAELLGLLPQPRVSPAAST